VATESQYRCLNVEICPWGQDFAGHCPHEVLVLKSSYWISQNKWWWEKKTLTWLVNSRDRYFQTTQSYALFCCLFVPSFSCPCLLRNCCWRQAEQCLTWPHDPHSQKRLKNVSRHHNSLLWVNSSEGESLAHLFPTRRSGTFPFSLVVENWLWLDAATMQRCWITDKSWLHLDLSTVVSVSKLISVNFFVFLLFFFPCQVKATWGAKWLCRSVFSYWESRSCKTMFYWLKSGRNIKWHFPSCLHAAFRRNQCWPRTRNWNHCYLPAGVVCPRHHRSEKEWCLGISTFGHWSFRCLGTSSCCKF